MAAANEASRPRGRHTIFLGYTVGVGKTQAMLGEALARAGSGDDVVIGYLERHVRPETGEIASKLEVFPLREVEYHGIVLSELDAEGIIERRPDLVVVDELAHSNPPGEVREKRWQDVELIVDAGIDVFSSINVQHVESVCGAASHVIGMPIRETVPDAVLDRASKVLLVDADPVTVIARAKRGEIYSADTLGPALLNVLRVPKLTALRDLALGVAAEHAAR